MNKHLLLGTALLVAISAFPQVGKLAKPSGILPMAPKKLDFNESTTQNAATFSGTTKHVQPALKANPNKVAAVSSYIFTGSMNVFGYLVSQSRPLQYTKEVGAISFIARKTTTYVATSNSNSGTIVGFHSTNLGTSWSESCIWSDATNLARYPNGGIYNPLGNTNVNNAYFVGSGPCTGGSGWLGNWYASKQISTPGTATSGTANVAHLDATPTIKKHAMSRYAFTTIDGGLVRSMATVVNDINSTANGPTGYGQRAIAMVKGAFSAGAFVWSVDTFAPPVRSSTVNNKLLYGVPLQAWDDAGVVGYVVVLGSRASVTPEQSGYQPIVYKTTTGGASWSLLPAENFADANKFRGVNERLYAINANTNIICPNFQGSEGFDAAVDINGNLHFASMVYGHTSTHVDTLGYRRVFGTEQYSYGNTGPFDYPIIYDFFTKSSGGWDYIMVDSMGTEGPSGTAAQPGYGTNLWSDGSGAKMDQDARIQMSRSADGKKMFYSWTESDSSIVGSKWNIYPDLKMKGFDVTLNKVTPRYNVTEFDPLLQQGTYYQYMSNKVIGSSSVCVNIPFTATKNTTKDGSINVDTYIIQGMDICPAAFSITPMSPTGVASISKTSVNFDVFNYPNPASDATTINVGLKTASYFEVAFYNSIGQLMTTYKVNGQNGSNQINVDLSSFNAGIYFYNVKVGNSVVTKKLVVQ